MATFLIQVTLAVAAVVGGGGLHAAEVSPMPGPCTYSGGCFLLSGPIVMEDLGTIGAALAKASSSKQSIVVRLNSPGGDFATAIALGRLMRSSGAHALGGFSDICMSSCVMVLAGAAFRGHAGRVGIHRPYRMSTAPISPSDMKKEFDSWNADARIFLREVNVSERLWDEMIRTPPEKVRVLSSVELATFGLKGEDPVFEEINDSNNARYYGVSKSEYLQRKALLAQICEPILQRGEVRRWQQCEDSVKRFGRFWEKVKN